MSADFAGERDLSSLRLVATLALLVSLRDILGLVRLVGQKETGGLPEGQGTLLLSFYVCATVQPQGATALNPNGLSQNGLSQNGYGYLYRSQMQPFKASETIVFTMNFNDFTIQRNMIFDDFHEMFRYKFWH